ncbi:MAG: hypothetical protein H0V55_00970, partial [Thermoleophilaceae bacterium]|nr:hypothetical protein [Thermoleophilaceae bacterium]
MSTRARAQSGGLRLEESGRALLHRRLEAASRRARAERRPVLAAVTVPVPAETDLSAAVLGSRGSTDAVFCLEQPARGGFVLAGLGAATVICAHG